MSQILTEHFDVAGSSRLRAARAVVVAVLGPTDAAWCDVRDLQGGRLVLAVRRAAMTARLRTQEGFLLSLLAREGLRVREIEFVVDPSAGSWQARKQSAARARRRRPTAEMAALASTVPERALGEQLLKWMSLAIEKGVTG